MKSKGKKETAKNASPAKKVTSPPKTAAKNDGKDPKAKSPTKDNKTANIKTQPKTQTEEPTKISKERLAKLNEDRKKRIKQQKKEDKENREIFEKILAENQGSGNRIMPFSSTTILTTGSANIKVSEKKAQEILEKGGMLDAYKYLIETLCKNGLPTGNLFEYSAHVIQSYEKKWKEKKAQEKRDKVEKYWIEKERENLKESKNDKSNHKKNMSLERRQENSFIKSLDRSRSSRKIKDNPYANMKTVEYDPLDMRNRPQKAPKSSEKSGKPKSASKGKPNSEAKGKLNTSKGKEAEKAKETSKGKVAAPAAKKKK